MEIIELTLSQWINKEIELGNLLPKKEPGQIQKILAMSKIFDALSKSAFYLAHQDFERLSWTEEEFLRQTKINPHPENVKLANKPMPASYSTGDLVLRKILETKDLLGAPFSQKDWLIFLNAHPSIKVFLDTHRSIYDQEDALKLWNQTINKEELLKASDIKLMESVMNKAQANIEKVLSSNINRRSGFIIPTYLNDVEDKDLASAYKAKENLKLALEMTYDDEQVNKRLRKIEDR